MTYVDGFLIPVPADKREAYREMAEKMAPVFLDHGAIEVVETWGDDLMKGKTTDFYMAVKAEPDENVVFSWIIWPDRATRDTGNKAAMADERMAGMEDMNMIDGKRMIFSGFQTIVSQKA